MKRRHAGAGVILVAFVALAVEPVAAQSINRELIRGLNRQLLYVAVPLALLVEVILFYAVWRHKDNEDPSPTRENHSLEIMWTLATAIILIFVGFAAYNVLTDPYISPSYGNDTIQSGESDAALQGAVVPDDPEAVTVRVIGYQWGWDFAYPDTNVTTTNVTVVPTNTDVYYHLTARQVIHAFHVPTLGLKQDVLPEKYTTIRTNISEPGTYRVYCSEFCGTGHAKMLANLTAVPPDQYQDWLAEQRRTQNGTPPAIDTANATNVTATSSSAARVAP